MILQYQTLSCTLDKAYHANLMLTETNFPQENLDVVIIGVKTQYDLAGISPNPFSCEFGIN